MGGGEGVGGGGGGEGGGGEYLSGPALYVLPDEGAGGGCQGVEGEHREERERGGGAAAPGGGGGGGGGEDHGCGLPVLRVRVLRVLTALRVMCSCGVVALNVASRWRVGGGLPACGAAR